MTGLKANGVLEILSAGPAVSVQDSGRPGAIARGLSRGGAADPLALDEAAALLGHRGAALEMAGFGATFRLTRAGRMALTGAPMQVRCDGAPLAWSAVHAVDAGQIIEIGAPRAGVYGYASFGGGFALAPEMGSQSAHLVAQIGGVLAAGEAVPLGEDPGGPVGRLLEVAPRFSGGRLRMVASAQTQLFSASEIERFLHATFARAPRGNRQGIGLDGLKLAGEAGLSLVSETIAPGDIQITGDGTPYVLMAECQTTGGYPRIGTVIAPDMPNVAQASPGVPLSFEMIDVDAALDALARARTEQEGLSARVQPLLRDPRDIQDLLGYSLISGAITGWDE
ncbi:5-oxoprolinase subunit C family protein [Roseobacteraceae bacterium S113]